MSNTETGLDRLVRNAQVMGEQSAQQVADFRRLRRAIYKAASDMMEADEHPAMIRHRYVEMIPGPLAGASGVELAGAAELLHEAVEAAVEGCPLPDDGAGNGWTLILPFVDHFRANGRAAGDDDDLITFAVDAWHRAYLEASRQQESLS